MTESLPISVVIPTIGRVDLLRACLESILLCDPAPAEVVVIDQSGSTAVRQLLELMGTGPVSLRAIECEGRGIGLATNLGFANAVSDFVLVTHDDCTVSPEWIGVGFELSTRWPDAVLTGRVLAPERAAYVPSTIADPHPKDWTGTITSGVLYPANMGVSRAAFVAFGGFDQRPALRLAAEDNDFCYRWLSAGKSLRYEPELLVWHHDWRSPEALVRTHIVYAHGQGAFYAKHLKAGDRRVLALLWWDLRTGVRTVVSGVAHRRPRWTDPYREMVVSLIVGLVRGWRS